MRMNTYRVARGTSWVYKTRCCWSTHLDYSGLLHLLRHLLLRHAHLLGRIPSIGGRLRSVSWWCLWKRHRSTGNHFHVVGWYNSLLSHIASDSPPWARVVKQFVLQREKEEGRDK